MPGPPALPGGSANPAPAPGQARGGGGSPARRMPGLTERGPSGHTRARTAITAPRSLTAPPMEPPGPRRAAPERGTRSPAPAPPLRAEAAAASPGPGPLPSPGHFEIPPPPRCSPLAAAAAPGLWVRRCPRRSGLGAACPRSACAAPPVPRRPLPAQAAIFCSIVTKELRAGSGRRQPEVEARARPRAGAAREGSPAQRARGPGPQGPPPFWCGAKAEGGAGRGGGVMAAPQPRARGQCGGHRGTAVPARGAACPRGPLSVGPFHVTSGVCALGRGDSVQGGWWPAVPEINIGSTGACRC